MAILKVENLTKYYGTTRALDTVSFECSQGEFFTLFGPSGAGKTTLLELIAGVKGDCTGTISIGGRLTDTLSIQDRNVAMVFENYALYPHLSVGENISFPLRSPRARKIGEADIAKKVQWTADELGIGQLLDRTPVQLSGGQKQRVSLARALVREADVYLLDEPIAHLDAKLRTVARANLKAMAANLGATIIYVTHDYREALGLSDRLALLNEGKVLQIGQPRQVYSSPRTDYVGYLLGDPVMNLLDGDLIQSDSGPCFRVGSTTFRPPARLGDAMASRLATGKTSCRLGIRPSGVTVHSVPAQGATELTVYAIEKATDHLLVHFEVAGILFGGVATDGQDLAVGKPAWVTMNPHRGHLFEASFPLTATSRQKDAA